MAGMSFGDLAESAWIVDGWMFRQVLLDLRQTFDLSFALAETIERAERVGFLHAQSLPDPLKAELVGCLGRMSRGILDNSYRSTIEDRFADSETRNVYREGIGMLLAAMRAAGYMRG